MHCHHCTGHNTEGPLQAHWRYSCGCTVITVQDTVLKVTAGPLAVQLWVHCHHCTGHSTEGSLQAHWRYSGGCTVITVHSTEGSLQAHWRYSGGCTVITVHSTEGSLQAHWRYSCGCTVITVQDTILKVHCRPTGGTVVGALSSLYTVLKFTAGPLAVQLWVHCHHCTGHNTEGPLPT